MSSRAITTAVALGALIAFAETTIAQDVPKAAAPPGEARSRDEPDAARSRDRDDTQEAPRDDATRQVQPRLLPPTPPPGGGRAPRWRLGVFVENLDTGVLLTGVAPFSAAARAGMEPGDTVVTVEGYQVGIVNGRLYDLGDELSRRAGQSGLVQLLILDRRGGRLANRDVQLDPAGGREDGGRPGPGRPAGVTGSVTYRERMALPPNAILVVRLVQAPPTGGPRGRPGVLGGPTPLVSERTMRNLGQVPIAFELPLDPRQLRPGQRYTLEAEIQAEGRTLFRGSAPYEPGRGGSGPPVEIVLQSARQER